MNKKAKENSNSVIMRKTNNTDIQSFVYLIRGQLVMLDSDLAALYQVETKAFNQAVS